MIVTSTKSDLTVCCIYQSVSLRFAGLTAFSGGRCPPHSPPAREVYTSLDSGDVRLRRFFIFSFLLFPKIIYINVQWSVDLIRYILTVFLALFYTFGQQILYLTVDRTEVVLRPCGDIVIQLFR